MRRRTISAMEARKHFGELLESVHYRGEAVTIERAGKPMVVMVSAGDYEEFEAKREAARARFFTLVDTIHARNAHIPAEEVEREVAEALAEVRRKL
jgi:prevent-host-death family protein